MEIPTERFPSLRARSHPPATPPVSLSAIAIDVRKIVSGATNMTTIKIMAMPMATGRRATPIETAGRYVILIALRVRHGSGFQAH